MSKTYSQVIKQIETLQAEAEKLRREEISGVIGRIREAIGFYGLTAADLGLGTAGAAKARKGASSTGRRKVHTEIKFRDEAGNVWGGRGPRPRWLRDALQAGKSLQDFEVKDGG